MVPGTPLPAFQGVTFNTVLEGNYIQGEAYCGPSLFCPLVTLCRSLYLHSGDSVRQFSSLKCKDCMIHGCSRLPSVRKYQLRLILGGFPTVSRMQELMWYKKTCQSVKGNVENGAISEAPREALLEFCLLWFKKKAEVGGPRWKQVQ